MTDVCVSGGPGPFAYGRTYFFPSGSNKKKVAAHNEFHQESLGINEDSPRIALLGSMPPGMLKKEQ